MGDLCGAAAGGGFARTGAGGAAGENGVPTAVYYPRPLHRQPAYERWHDGARLPVSEDLAERILALPIHADLDEAALGYVCEQVVEAVAGA